MASVYALVLLAALPALGQSVDAAFSLGTTAATGFGAGIWPGGSATVMFTPHIGANGEWVFRATDAIGRNFNPYAGDLNLTLRATAMRWTPELLLGYGAVGDESAAYNECTSVFATPPQQCGSPHQLFSAAHLGLNVKTYVSPRTFLRIEYHLYGRFGQQYPSIHPSRFAVSVGYTFGGLR